MKLSKRRRAPSRRDFDVGRSMRRTVIPAIIVYFILSLSTMFLVGFRAAMIAGAIGLGIFVIAAITQRRRMAASHKGYNMQENDTRPLFPVGRRPYKRYRVDTGGFEGMHIGFNPYRDRLVEREEQQRKQPCEVCGDTPDANGGYFVEHRTVTRFLWVPIQETIHETEAYCVDHPPNDFQ